MSPEQQRIKLAEWGGWEWGSIPADGGCFGWVSPEGGFPQDGIESLPNYLNDLNAVHELEKRLTEKQELFYLVRLTEAMKEQATVGWKIERTYHATAAQRCVAMLRTLGLYEPQEEKVMGL